MSKNTKSRPPKYKPPKKARRKMRTAKRAGRL